MSINGDDKKFPLMTDKLDIPKADEIVSSVKRE